MVSFFSFHTLSPFANPFSCLQYDGIGVGVSGDERMVSLETKHAALRASFERARIAEDWALFAAAEAGAAAAAAAVAGTGGGAKSRPPAPPPLLVGSVEGDALTASGGGAFARRDEIVAALTPRASVSSFGARDGRLTAAAGGATATSTKVRASLCCGVCLKLLLDDAVVASDSFTYHASCIAAFDTSPTTGEALDRNEDGMMLF